MSQLTNEQRYVATLSPASRQLVTAGPGTGKTYALIARLQFLIDECDLGAGDEVLVLSFSRAAVREIRARLQNAGANQEDSAVRRVRAQTFDSFATALLSDIEPEGDWQKHSYDKRIEAATVLLRENSNARQSLSELGHILVDEAQDLVGARDELVRAILEAAPQSGWTLFGDPAQGIYNFGLEPQARKVGAWALYAWLHRTFGAQIKATELTINHRATSPKARDLAAQMAPIGNALGAPAPDYDAVRSSIEDVLFGLDADGTINDPVIQAALKTSERQKTAILCRNNGEALMLSRALWEHGISHHYRRGATERALPAWIADVLGDYQIERIAKDSFLERCAERCPEVEAERAFMTLRRLASGGRNALDLDGLARRIREDNVPDELCQQPDAALTISTVHRAKGLEFERVYLLAEPMLDTDKPDWEEELRVWYVALTRPRKLLYRLEPVKASYRLGKCEKTERWQRTFFHQTMRFNVADVEVRGGDSHWLDPAGAWGMGAPILQTQDYIRAQVRAGDEVSLRLVLGRAEDAESCAHYGIFHGETLVGLTAEEFGRDLRRMLKRHPNWNFDFPPRLEKLRVDAVDTVAGRPDTGRKQGLGERGLWLRVRVAGLGAFGWNES